LSAITLGTRDHDMSALTLGQLAKRAQTTPEQLARSSRPATPPIASCAPS